MQENLLKLYIYWHRCHNIHKLGNDKLHVKITARRISQIYRGYPEKLRFLSAFGVTPWIPKWEGIHLVTPKALKTLNFSGYPLTWVSISLHQKHSKISTFQDTLSLRYIKSTQKSTFEDTLSVEFSIPELRILWHLLTNVIRARFYMWNEYIKFLTYKSHWSVEDALT